MDRMLVVVLDDRDLDRVTYSPLCPSEKTMKPADSSIRSRSFPSSDLDLLNSQADELRQFSCDCQIATSLPEADALLAERHFDSVIFDFDVFDGKEHHLISQLSGSAAPLFSRLDVEDGCWWFPADMVCREGWELKSIMPMGSGPVLHEILRQLVSGTSQNRIRQATPSAQFLPSIPGKQAANTKESSKDFCFKSRWMIHRAEPAAQKQVV